MFKKYTYMLMVSSIALTACATTPLGPTVQVLPGANKPFQVFTEDQDTCKKYAEAQTKGQADAANNKAVGSALLGTALGVGLGAAVGGSRGAGTGAAVGAIVGTGVGTDKSQDAQYSIQQQYDNAYIQCMYAKGNQVPGVAHS